MKALVKLKKGYGNIEICEMPEPICGEGDVKIEVKAVGLCGSDLHIMHDALPYTPPVILGHEFCGRVAEVGTKVTGFKVGDRVVAENVSLSCGVCSLCQTGHYAICAQRSAQGLNRDGGFAKYIVCQENFVFKIPDNISFEEGALLEPLTCCVHGVIEQCKVRAGDIVLVSGPGSIGLLTAMVAKAEGGFVVMTGTDDDKDKLQLALELGVDKVVNIEKEALNQVVAELTRGRGVDVVLECSGAEAAVNSGLNILKQRGRFTQVGLFGKQINLNLDLITMKEIRLEGTLSHTRDAWLRGIRLIEEGKIDLKPLLTHKYSVLEWEKAFETFQRRKCIKIVLIPE